MLERVEIGSSIIYLYDAMSLLGIICAFVAFIIISKAFRIDEWKKALFLFTLSMVTAHIFSFILGDITYYTDWESFKKTILVPDASFFIGGIPIGLGLFLILSRKFIKKKDIVNYTIPSLLIIQAISRIGCLFAGCCYGIPSKSIMALQYPPSSPATVHFGENTTVLPLPLFEAVFLALLLAAVLCMLKTERGEVLPVYFITYGTYMFINSFFLGEVIFSPLGIHFPGWIGLVFIICGIILLLSKPKK